MTCLKPRIAFLLGMREYHSKPSKNAYNYLLRKALLKNVVDSISNLLNYSAEI